MINGINLGGWLVLERWMTPSLFLNVTVEDEYGLSGMPDRKKILKQHRDTFITEKDFKTIAEAGFTCVRLPIGHWSFGGYEPFIENASYIDKAFAWAEKHNLQILLDLHTAPGSQNGQDHSGKSGELLWHINPENIHKTVDVVGEMARRYGSSKALWGIQLLNEPDKMIPLDTLQNYYRRAYDEVRETCGERVAVVIHDAYRPLAEWQDFVDELSFKNMLLDTHLYQLFSEKERAHDLQGHIDKTFKWEKMLQQFGPDKIIIGEWTAALHGTYNNIPQVKSQLVAQLYKDAQKSAFATTTGMFYWNYKTEENSVWNYQSTFIR